MARFHRRDFLKAVGVGSAAAVLPVAITTTQAAAGVSTASTDPDGGLRGGFGVSVSPNGDWRVTVADLDWTFAGSVGVTVTDIDVHAGSDGLGVYRETSFAYQSGGSRRAAIRVYDASPVAVFTDTYVDAAANANPFPAISDYPRLPYLLSHQGTFGEYQLNSVNNAADSPWFFFDEAAGTFVLSAADHVQQAATTLDANKTLVAGVASSITELPAGFSKQTILTATRGIGATYRAWGNALTALAGKRRPPNDRGVILAKLGYWTDHGAVYYYTYERSLGYTGTLQAVADEWAAKRIPFAYLQLDSWWYPKGPQAQWNSSDGEYLYTADTELFPYGLAAFQRQIDVPLITHARWIDPSSPYHQQYAMSGEVIIDPAFWRTTMSYLREAGVVVYEQDWLSAGAQPVQNLTDPDAFFGNMASAAAADGLDMQYCMPLPRDYLQTINYDNLTTIRVSDDRFEPGKWNTFLYDSQLAGALGVWPWCDVFMSTETTNLLLANLSAGPVGVGDGLGQENPDNLFQVVRYDGVIVKPDTPIVPTDATYIGEAAGELPAMVAGTRVDHGSGLCYGYVFAYARQIPAPQAVYQAEDAILSGAVVATDNSGYTGTGYADYQNASGDYVEWSFQAPAAGTYTLGFRYANGDTAARPLAVTLDGAADGTLPFASTGGWTSWQVQSLVTTLAAGTHTVRLTATGASGGNIDYLGVSQGTVPTTPTQPATFELDDVGITTDGYVYDYFAKTGSLLHRGERFTATVTSGTYWVVAPVGRSGIAFLGDAGKFVSHGRARVAAVSDDGRLHATVVFAEDEQPVTLHGYAPRRPAVAVSSGRLGAVAYDTATKLFTVEVGAAPSNRAQVTISV